MEYRQLGNSGLSVSTIVLGTMTFGGSGVFAKTGNTDAVGARRLVDIAVDAGVNMLDTADIYSDGLCEEIIGDILTPELRNRVLIGTKVRFPNGPGPNDRGLSRHHIISSVESSLRRLKTDYLDIYWCHEWDGVTPLQETLHAMDDLVKSGKIRYYGVSNYAGWQLMKTLHVASQELVTPPIAQQIHYSLQAREAEYELLPIAVDQSMGAMVWSPLAGGLLSGKYRRGVPEPKGTRKAAAWPEPPVRDVEALYDVVEVLVERSAARGDVTPSQLALAWVLERTGVDSIVIGARTEDQLLANLNAATVVVGDEDRDALEKISRPPLIYPYWHQQNSAADRLSPADHALHGPWLAEK